MSNEELICEPPHPKKRLLIFVTIVLFLSSQVWVPVSYYLNDEPTSERFAWRMFSSVDQSTWETKVTILREQNGQLFEIEEPIASSLQETYVKSVQKAQLDIVEPYMRSLLLRPEVREVRFLAKGRFPSGKSMPPIQLVMREDGKLETVSI